MKKLLVIRLSALGDVAMTVPVVSSLAHTCPDLSITVLSRPFMQPLFATLPANVRFRGVDLNQYKGIGGLFRLYRELRGEGFDAVADFHDVLRTKVLRALFRLSGVRTARIDKGRAQRKALTRPRDKRLTQLPTSFARYEGVLARLGLPAHTRFRSIYGEGRGDAEKFRAVAGTPGTDGPWIGIAPFAAHAGKRLPADTALRLIRLLAARPGWRIFLFGGGKEEKEQMERWAEGLPNVLPLAGKLKLDGELALMSHLDAVVSMDSGNMHLASLTATPVVSVWGATHPLAGFMGWKQTTDNAVQADLPCRPCSIFGNKPCLRGDYACLHTLKAEDIVKKIDHILGKTP